LRGNWVFDEQSFGVNEDISQIVIDQTARLFAEQLDSAALARADRGEWSADLWTEVNAAGLPLALVDETAGGAGLPWHDVAGLLRLIGYHAVPLPLPETILANWLWCKAGGEVFGGPVALASATDGDRISLIAEGDSFLASGRVSFVPWLSVADRVLIQAADSDGRQFLILIDHRGNSEPARRNIANEPRQIFELSGRRIPASDVRPWPAQTGKLGLLPYVAAMRTQQIVGAMERCVEHALRYANERVQFGRPIAKFQAIQQMLALAAGHLAAATAAADALAELSSPDENLFVVAVAKARCSEAAGPVAAICHQVHGAMGFTREHPLHFSTRRLWSWRDEGGSETFWQEWIGRQISERGSEALWSLIVDTKLSAGLLGPGH
jgi:acyl-CoA dehydrogenase